MKYVTVTPYLKEMDLPSCRLQRGHSMSLTDGVGTAISKTSIFILRQISKRNVGKRIQTILHIALKFV